MKNKNIPCLTEEKLINLLDELRKRCTYVFFAAFYKFRACLVKINGTFVFDRSMYCKMKMFNKKYSCNNVKTL